jgi:integrase
LYRLQRDTEVAQGDVRQTTVTAEFKNIRNAIKHFPNGLPMDNLTLAIITDAKAKLLRAVGRRTAKNYLAAMKAMLKWFYDGSDYGKQHDKPTNFDRIFGVSGAVRTDIKTATSATLKKLLEISSDRQRLYIMLALNCGMYQADIGYLQPSEIDIDGGYAFWDRSKEPQNPFKVRHDLWAETLQLVKRFYQHDGEFAFVSDDGLPLYDVKDAKEGGNTYDRVGQTYTPLRRAMPTAPQFHELRKSTNQALTDLLHRQAEPMAIAEISKEFLGQKTPTLARVYATSGLHSYDRMNRYLKAVGKKFRADGVFDALKGQ